MPGNLLGVVLCGGESKRMGSDKGLLVKEEKQWAVWVAGKLQDCGLETIVSINAGQEASYRVFFNDTPFVLDQAIVHGPLNGLLSVHHEYPDRDLLLMACDLIDMDHDTLTNLIDTYGNTSGFDFYVYRQGTFAEPFCAIYTARGLAEIMQLLAAGKLKRFSLHERFENGKTLYLDIPGLSVFKNFNHPA